MATLDIASKASQATTFPSLLLSHLAKETDPTTKIDIKFEEVDCLDNNRKNAVTWTSAGNESVFGHEDVLSKLCQNTGLIKEHNHSAVCLPFCFFHFLWTESRKAERMAQPLVETHHSRRESYRVPTT